MLRKKKVLKSMRQIVSFQKVKLPACFFCVLQQGDSKVYLERQKTE